MEIFQRLTQSVRLLFPMNLSFPPPISRSLDRKSQGGVEKKLIRTSAPAERDEPCAKQNKGIIMCVRLQYR